MTHESAQKVLDPATGDSVPRVSCRATGELTVERASLNTERLTGTVASAGTCQVRPGSRRLDIDGPTGRIWAGLLTGTMMSFQLSPDAGSDASRQLCDFVGSILEQDAMTHVPDRIEGTAICQNPPYYDTWDQELWDWEAVQRDR